MSNPIQNPAMKSIPYAKQSNQTMYLSYCHCNNKQHPISCSHVNQYEYSHHKPKSRSNTEVMKNYFLRNHIADVLLSPHYHQTCYHIMTRTQTKFNPSPPHHFFLATNNNCFDWTPTEPSVCWSLYLSLITFTNPSTSHTYYTYTHTSTPFRTISTHARTLINITTHHTPLYHPTHWNLYCFFFFLEMEHVPTNV